MWNMLRDRLGESSTYVGLALLLQGIDKTFNVPAVAPYVEGVASVGQAVATKDPVAIAMSLAGLGMVLVNQTKYKR